MWKTSVGRQGSRWHVPHKLPQLVSAGQDRPDPTLHPTGGLQRDKMPTSQTKVSQPEMGWPRHGEGGEAKRPCRETLLWREGGSAWLLSPNGKPSADSEQVGGSYGDSRWGHPQAQAMRGDGQDTAKAPFHPPEEKDLHIPFSCCQPPDSKVAMCSWPDQAAHSVPATRGSMLVIPWESALGIGMR